MSVKKEARRIIAELKAKNVNAHVSGKMGKSILIEIPNTTVDVVLCEVEDGVFDYKLGLRDQFSTQSKDGLIKAVLDSISS